MTETGPMNFSVYIHRNPASGRWSATIRREWYDVDLSGDTMEEAVGRAALHLHEHDPGSRMILHLPDSLTPQGVFREEHDR